MAGKGDVGSPKQGGGQQQAMVGCAKRQAGHVGHGQTDESDGAAQCGAHCTESAAQGENRHPQGAQTVTQILRIGIAEQERVERFAQTQ